ncbi:DVU_1556 family methyltransferase [Maridesulfovibrio sp.]|uniref:DVU_1556 family methyltransferase n=1 Tax=Maridesulfovibrio sp. TaxID=2795000 RepID=UPI002A186EA6|nr:methyltransferase domain-containing protein [Maridesulfovibrio sp.]
MQNPSAVPLWERTVLRDTAGSTLRPGGFALTDRAVDLARIPSGSRVLDVGCGLGATVEHLRSEHGFDACGIDNSVRQLSEAPGDLPLTLAEASCIPCADSFFDALFCECVLSLMPDQQKCITEFSRILKKDGKLIITDLYQRGEGEETTDLKCSCASSPLDLNNTEKHLYACGMHIAALEDHSKLLAELAARLIFAGEPDFRLTGNCCRRPGYMLMIAEMNRF